MARSYLGHQVPTEVAEILDPRVSAVVAIDLQNDFIHDDGHFGGSAGLQGIVAPTVRLTDAARSGGVAVHFAQIVQEADGSAASPSWLSEALRRGYEPRQCIRGSWGAANVDELVPQPGDRVHQKRRRSAFIGTELAETLRADGVTTLVLAGLAADGCVEYTARNALDLDFHVVVAVDAIGNAGDQPGADWSEHYRGLLPAENILRVDEITAHWPGHASS